MSSKKQKRNNSSQLRLSDSMDNPKKTNNIKKTKIDNKKEDEKIPINATNLSGVDDEMSVTSTYNRIKNFEKDLISNKKIDLSGEYDIKNLEKSLDILSEYLQNFRKMINTIDYHYIDLGPNVKPFFHVVQKENKEERNVIKIDDVDSLPDFSSIFDDFKNCEETEEISKEDIKIKKNFDKK